MARVRLFTVAGLVREETRPGTIPLTRCQRGLRAARGDLDLHMILATYFPMRWAAIKGSIHLPPREDDRRRLIEIAMDELPALFPVYDKQDFLDPADPADPMGPEDDQLYHEMIPVLGPDIYCPFTADPPPAPAELLLFALCRPDDGAGCCLACEGFDPRVTLRAVSGDARRALAPLVALALEDGGAYHAIASDAARVCAAAPSPWRDVPLLARLMGRDTGNAYLDLDPDSWDEATQCVGWTLGEVRFFARSYAEARAYRTRIAPLRAALAAQDAPGRLAGLLAARRIDEYGTRGYPPRSR